MLTLALLSCLAAPPVPVHVDWWPGYSTACHARDVSYPLERAIVRSADLAVDADAPPRVSGPHYGAWVLLIECTVGTTNADGNSAVPRSVTERWWRGLPTVRTCRWVWVEVPR